MLLRTPLPTMALALALALALASLTAGCSPALDWREARPAQTGLLLLFPCKPNAQERRLALAGKSVQVRLHACAAGGSTWGLAAAELEDPGLLGAAMEGLRAAAAANISAGGVGASGAQAMQVAGATPHPGSGQVRLAGTRPDGQPVQMHMAVFARGTQVFQASALGDKLGDEDVQTFVSSMRFAP